MFKSTRLKKVLRDLFENKTRTLLVILSISVGIFSFGSMFITQEILLSDMSSQYKAIGPSTITLYGGPFGKETVEWLKNQEGVSEAMGKISTAAKVVTPKKTYNIDLTTYDDFENMPINRMNSENGSWPPQRGEIILERTTANLLKVNKGDLITIELPDGKQKQLIYGGSVHDLNAIPANLFPQLSGYVSKETLTDLKFRNIYNQLEILTSNDYVTKDQLLNLGESLKTRLENRGVRAGGIQTREPGKHWGEDNSKAFIAILDVIGTFSLILSGFLVINTIGSILAQQKRQIGVMKAVGASNKQVVQLYLLMVAVYGLLGLLVALPVSLGLGYVFLKAIDDFLNLNIINYHLPAYVFFMEAAAAILVPTLAGLIPIIGGSKLPVVNALSNFSGETKTSHSFIYRMVTRIRGLSRPILLSLRNTFQKQGRLWLTIGTLTVAGTLFMSVINTRSGLMAEIYNILKMFQFDITLNLEKDYDIASVTNKLRSYPDVEVVEPRNGVGGQIIKEDGSKGESISFSGLPYDSKLVSPGMLSGRWLTKEDRNAIVVSSPLAKDNPDLKTGSEITVEINNKKYKFEIVGIVSMVGDKMAFVPIDYLGEVREKPNVASEMLLTVGGERKNNLAATTDEIRGKLKKSGIEVAQFTTVDTILTTNQGQFDFLIAFLLAMAVMVAAVGGLGLAGTMSMNVMDRTREIGVLRSIGATNGALRKLVMTEGLTIGLFSWILAVPLSIPGTIGFSYILGMAFFERPMEAVYNWWGAVIWFGLVMTIAVVASIVPANRASKMSIRETLSYE